MLQNPRLAQRVFRILSVCLLVLLPILSQQYGQNGDEDVEAQYGQDIWNFYAHGDKQALDYDTQLHPEYGTNITGMHFYGGMFNLLAETVHQVFPSWHIMEVRHFFSALFGALLMIFTGLLLYRISKGNWWLAILGMLFMVFSPRLFGESMNNGKDIPFAAGMLIAIYYFYCFLQTLETKRASWLNATGIMVGSLITFGMRPAGGLLLVAYIGLFTLIWLAVHKERRIMLIENKYRILKRSLLQLVLAFGIAYALCLFTWPFGLSAPIKNLFAALSEMSNRSVIIRTLYDGIYYASNDTPWHYHFKWITITTPIIIIVTFFLFFPLFFKAIKTYGLLEVFILVFAALFPLLYIIYKGSTNYDSWRHVFFVYPFWVIMAALSVDMISRFLKDKLKWIPMTAAFVGLLPAVAWTFKSHPHQYVYFNAFTGGPAGAFGYYDLDYYLVSGKASAEWIIENVPKPPAGERVRVWTNMEGMDTYFRNDTSWIYSRYARYYERSQHDWDYYITYGRFVSVWQLQNGKWPPAHVVHAIEVDGVPIGVVLKRSSKASYHAYEALQKNDFETAVGLYAEYLKTDTTDETVYVNYAIALASVGRLPEAVQAMEHATRLDGSRADFYQILAQIYQGMGDQQKAQQAMMRGQSMMAQEQLAQ